MTRPAGSKVLVTGGTGFIGTHLVRELLGRGFQVRITGQERNEGLEAAGAQWLSQPDLTGEVDWSDALEGMDMVVHLAGIAHRLEASGPDDWALYDKVNHVATRSLAATMKNHPTARRLVFMSSVRVHGDPDEFPVREDSPLKPATPYDRSKVEAEKAIRELLPPGSPVHWAILRPVLVYGPGNRGNMAKLEGLLRKGIPVPTSTRPNRRSFLFVGNLTDAVLTYLTRAEVPTGRTWILADREPSSTARLYQTIGRTLGLPARCLQLPDWALTLAARTGDLLSRLGLPTPWTSEVARKVLGDFHVDISAVRSELNWTPPFELEEGIALTYGR